MVSKRLSLPRTRGQKRKAVGESTDARLNEIMSFRRDDKVDRDYEIRLSKIANWLKQNCEHDCVDDDGKIIFANVSAEDFLRFLSNKKLNNGNDPGSSDLSKYRTAFQNAATASGFEVGTDFRDKMYNFFTAYKKREKKNKKESKMKIAMQFELFRAICCALWVSGKPQAPGLLFLFLLSWNLIARVGHASKLKFANFRVDGDAIKVYYDSVKRDEEGELFTEPRHIYANTLDPAMNVNLAMGLYFLVHQDFGDEAADINFLFPGAKQKNKVWNDAIKEVLETPECQSILKDLHQKAKDIRGHSMRKGAAGKVTSGMGDNWNIVAVCLRACWSLGDIFQRYFFQLDAGDRTVGRSVCGLNPNNGDFATLPPHFIPGSADIVDDAVKNVFPFVDKLPDSMHCVLKRALASLVYSFDWMEETLSPDSKARSNILFRDPELLESLKPLVTVAATAENNDPMVATGLLKTTMLFQQMGEIKETLSRIPDMIEAALRQIDYDRGNITGETVTNAVNAAIAPLQTTIQALVGSTDRAAASSGSSSAAIMTRPDGAEPFMWGGKYHFIPEGWELPKERVHNGFFLWCQGTIIDGKKTIPLRRIPQGDFARGSARNRFYEWRHVFSLVEKEAQEKKGLKISQTPSSVEVERIWDAGKGALYRPTKSPKGHNRMVDVSITYMYSCLRKNK